MADKIRTYQSDRKHTRLDFSQLLLSVNLVCITPDSPTTQTANAEIGQYEPDRSITPTVIRPEVKVNDPDGIYSSGVNNRNLASDRHEWFVNSTPIASVWKVGTDYDIIRDDTDDNGSLMVKRNLVPGEVAELAYRGIFHDFRTGTNYVAEVRGMALTTTDKGSNKIDCFVDCEQLSYDPISDDLLLYEYLVAEGKEKAGQRDNYINSKCYERTVNVTITSGASTLSALPKGWTMRLVERGKSTALVANTLDRPEITAISFPTIKFDMRFVWNKEYEVQILDAKSNILASKGISLVRDMSMLTQHDVERSSDIVQGQQRYFNRGIFAVGDKLLKYPQLYYEIQWWTQARVFDAEDQTYKYAERINRQIGESMECSVESLGIGTEKNLCWFDVAMDIEERDVAKILTTHDSNVVLTDENGNILITY